MVGHAVAGLLAVGAGLLDLLHHAGAQGPHCHLYPRPMTHLHPHKMVTKLSGNMTCNNTTRKV